MLTTVQSLILESYYPVLKINLNTEDFEEINAVTDFASPHTSISQFYFNFAQDAIFATDVQDFLQFMNIYNNIKYFDENPTGRKVCYYRYLIDNQYRWVHAEIRPDKNYSPGSRVVYLVQKEAGGEPRVEKILANARNELGSYSELAERMDEYRKTFPTSIGLIIVRTTDPRIKDTLSITHGGANCYQYSDPDTYAVLVDSLTPEDFSEDLMNLFSFLRGYEDYAIGTCWSDDEYLGMNHVLQSTLNKLEKFIKDKGGRKE